MKLKFRSICLVLLTMAITGLMVGCASGPKLGQPNAIQRVLNELPAIPIAGKDLKIEFGGDTWIAKVDGKDYMAGTFTSEDNSDGSVLTLKQTHIYSTEQKPGIGGDVGWVKTPGPDIALEYKKGPPETLSVK
ncbi:MAG: hypothetical protein LBI40_03385 [Treponema sp.]|jgi:hypothetical protein|nr:hypothetical protein [Treponema sp.]